MGRDVVRIRIASIKAKNIHFKPVDESIAAQVGNIGLIIPDIPLTDAMIAATAETFTNSLVLTNDPHFQKNKRNKNLLGGVRFSGERRVNEMKYAIENPFT